MRIVITLCAAMLAAAPALAADWRFLNSTRDDDGFRAADFIDVESMRRTGAQATFWKFTVYEHLVAGMDNSRVLFRVDCETHSYVVLQSAYYLRRASINSTGYQATQYAPPGTVIYGAIDAACGNRPLNTTTIADPYATAKEAFATTPR